MTNAPWAEKKRSIFEGETKRLKAERMNCGGKNGEKMWSLFIADKIPGPNIQ
jgi:hypothetical protein